MRGVIFLLALLVWGCAGQGNESYWKTKDITKVDGTVMTGITLAYAEALAGMNIHLAKLGDSLVFYYPHEKVVKIDELKSLTGYRLEESGELVDSIYDISIEGGVLKLKFYYIGTAQEDKTFSLNLEPMDKADFLAQVATLKAERKQLLDKSKPVVVSRLDLSIPKPGYFNEKDLTALSPMQGVEEFLGVKSDTIQPLYRTFHAGKGEAMIDYEHLGVITSAKAQPYVATFEDIPFSAFEFIINTKSKKTEAIILAGDVRTGKSIRRLFDVIDTDMPMAKITYAGLPEQYYSDLTVGIESSIALIWTDEHQSVKLLIDKIPDDLYEAGLNNKIAIPASAEPNGDVIRKVFLHYLSLVDHSGVRVFIVSPEFDAVLRSKDYSGDIWGNIEDYYSGN